MATETNGTDWRRNAAGRARGGKCAPPARIAALTDTRTGHYHIID